MPLTDRELVTWRQLCAIVRTTITDDDDRSTWRARIVAKLEALHCRCQHPAMLERAMQRYDHLLPPTPAYPRQLPLPERPDPTIVRAPARPPPPAMTRAGLSPPTWPVCGCSKPVSGATALRCTRAPGHDGEHGMHVSGLDSPLFVRWARSAADDAPAE